MLKSWKTTLAGIATILAGLAALAKCLTAATISTECLLAALAVIGPGVGLLFAKDGNVTGGTTPQTVEAASRTEVKP